MRIKHPAVAGTFYPDNPDELRTEVARYLKQGAERPSIKARAVIAPHAGYMYSGAIAGSAYAALAGQSDRIKRVALFGPSHRVPVRGLALPDCDELETPLGTIPLDKEGVELALGFPFVSINAAAHREEHSLEVQLPFLQSVLQSFTIVPFAVGSASPQSVSDLLQALWRDDTAVVISSDLSHYHDYASAQALDEATARSIEALHYKELRGDRACGAVPVAGLLHLAVLKGLTAYRLDVRNSGDTAGRRDAVVGYGAWAFA